MAEPALLFQDVRKRFGKTRALDGLTLEVPQGSFFGLIGPNGAGKTTAFSLACGFLKPDKGEVQILGGVGYELPRLKGRVGALPQDAVLGRETRCFEHLHFFGRLQGLSDADGIPHARVAMRRIELFSVDRRWNRQQLFIAHAKIPQAELIRAAAREDRGGLAIKPFHIRGGAVDYAVVAREVIDVRGEIGVIRREHRHAQHL